LLSALILLESLKQVQKLKKKTSGMAYNCNKFNIWILD